MLLMIAMLGVMLGMMILAKDDILHDGDDWDDHRVDVGWRYDDNVSAVGGAGKDGSDAHGPDLGKMSGIT